jgi:exodeoxyribonuclease VII small subunit
MTDADGDGTPPPVPESYEKARDELAAVVAALEEGGLTLDESLALWERGQALAAACERFLAGARERVQAVLAEDSGQDSGEDSVAGAGG